MAATSRGLTMTDIRRMTLGQVVDYCIEWQNLQETPEAGKKQKQKQKQKKGRKRKATQADWDSFLG